MKIPTSIIRLKFYCAVLDFMQDWYKTRNFPENVKIRKVERINELRKLTTDKLSEEISEYESNPNRRDEPKS